MFGPELDPADVLGAVGLDEDVAHPELPCQAVSTGAYHVLAPVRDAGALAGAVARLRPHRRRCSRSTAATCLYVVAPEPDAGTARARSFFAAAEPGEDPATGSAAGPLCAYLAQRDRRAARDA